MKWNDQAKGFVTICVLTIFLSLWTGTYANTQDISDMRGSMEYWITETEAAIEFMEESGELEDIIGCRRTILNYLRLIIGQLDAEDALLEFGPPE